MNDIQTLGNTYENTHEVGELDYRGFKLKFYFDEIEKQYYTYWQGKRIDFGICNSLYNSDMEYIIDKELNLITYITRDLNFSREGGMFELSYFKNGGYIDVGLYQGGRLIKVFNVDLNLPDSSNYLVATPDKIKLMEEALNFIKNNLR